MPTARPSALALTIVMVLAAGCGPRRVARQLPGSTPPTTIVLLPDPESGTTGRARVSNEFGSADLAAPRASTRITADGPPGPVTALSDEDMKRLFGDVFAALPPAPRDFTLYFRFESDALTDASTALLPDILETVMELAVPEVMVVGHTDTMGDPKANFALGMKRAMSVRGILVKAGLATSMIEVTSHGEGNLLVRTPDNRLEPRNRRVQITVR